MEEKEKALTYDAQTRIRRYGYNTTRIQDKSIIENIGHEHGLNTSLDLGRREDPTRPRSKDLECKLGVEF
ncbi:hypothetical protein M5K25_007180 [Dendrobium thyrsiflorum]|uniref:Uncharacterized protein n=1 Tax=Dendrobium thyrsiflorum TaxID=117978 RepID=A0ABD0VD57_DENTH